MEIKKIKLISIVASIALMASGALGQSKPEPKIEDIFRQALAKEFTPEREVIVSVVEVPPNTTMERHWHPGEEFHYCLEGEIELQVDGQPAILETPGKVSHVPYKKLHTVVTKEKSAKILVFRVHHEGEPVRYSEDEPKK
jgi:quercetin dioxygenase-like cupin family protein